uniref:Uncharacterized protein n=1 Tax=Arundo donax TaxID=35708 RepID=A0A0A9AP01_ARUDO
MHKAEIRIQSIST